MKTREFIEDMLTERLRNSPATELPFPSVKKIPRESCGKNIQGKPGSLSLNWAISVFVRSAQAFKGPHFPKENTSYIYKTPRVDRLSQVSMDAR